ncbi:MAG: tRNA 2-thiouridine(34) synthase MnmA [Candidatus Paceibacterota bacterium]
MKKKKIVFVGLSGGVDSAVSAALLKKQGYEVVGVFIKTWHPEFLECNEEEERIDAMRVAAFLDIPFLTFNFEEVYKKEVADYMIREYRLGRTPNPDVMCNKEVKFGAFLKKALSMGADFVATGHYAQVSKSENTFSREYPASHCHHSNKYYLLRSPDDTKDQSYFLWTLKQEQLNKILFPIGNLKKSEVRKLAKKFNLPVAEKKDSQGICFLGAVDLKDFLKHYIKPKRGKVILAPQEAGNEEREEIGYHEGVVFHTLGERHGFTITKKTPTDGAYYIVDKDVKKNILFVSPNKNSLSESPRKILLNFRSRLGSSASVAFHKENFCLEIENTNWISKIPEKNKTYTAQIRYHSEFLPCTIKVEGSEYTRRVQIFFRKPILVASGQSCVIYDGDVCLGGGVVV